MSITVHDPELWQRVMGYEAPDVTSSSTSRKHPSREEEGKRTGSRVSTSSIGVHRSSSQLMRAKEWLTRKATRNMSSADLTSHMCKEFALVSSMCDELREREDKLLQELEEYLAAQASHDQCKREMLYKKWSERVFTPIQIQLAEWMDSTFTDLHREKRRLFSQYLSLRNHKDVFLDTMTTSEYDPLTLTSGCGFITTSRLEDPLTVQPTDHIREQALLKDCERGKGNNLPPAPPLGWEDTDPVLWLAMQLMQINSEARQRSRLRLRGTRNCSHLDSRGVEGELISEVVQREPMLPHKTPIHHKHTPISLKWEEPEKNNTK